VSRHSQWDDGNKNENKKEHGLVEVVVKQHIVQTCMQVHTKLRTWTGRSSREATHRTNLYASTHKINAMYVWNVCAFINFITDTHVHYHICSARLNTKTFIKTKFPLNQSQSPSSVLFLLMWPCRDQKILTYVPAYQQVRWLSSQGPQCSALSEVGCGEFIRTVYMLFLHINGATMQKKWKIGNFAKKTQKIDKRCQFFHN